MSNGIVPIELTEIYPSGTTKRTGSTAIVLAEHDKIQFRVKVQNGDWVDYLAQTVPNGKQWSLSAGFFIMETAG